MLENFQYGGIINIIRFYQTIFQALVDQAQDDYNAPSDGYISPLGIYEEQIIVQSSRSISQQLRTKHILWAIQRVSEKLAARRMYGEVQATIVVSNNLRQRVGVGTIKLRRVRRSGAISDQEQAASNTTNHRDIQTANSRRQATEAQSRTALSSENYRIDIEFSFYQDGHRIQMEPLFLALIRAINFFAIPRSDLIITNNFHEYDEPNDITIALKCFRYHDKGLRYVDVINAFNTCADAALRYRRYSDSMVAFKYRRIELGLLVVLKGDVPDMPPAMEGTAASVVSTVAVASVSANTGVSSS